MLSLLKRNLSPRLSYHGIHHTIQVYCNVMLIAKALKINQKDLRYLKLGVLFHDAGFLNYYDGHENEGCVLANEIMPKFGYNHFEIQLVCQMIEATKIPQKPQNLLEQIIADADLLYLGTDSFETIAQTLYEEREVFFGHTNIDDWNAIQIEFLKKHRFHTEYCIQKYEPKKQEHLQKLINLYS